MSDGMYEGYRAELEAADRARRMSLYGTDLCYTCGQILGGGPKISPPGPRETVEFDRDVFLQAELVLEKGKPVPPPKKVTFCTEFCKARHEGAMHLVSRMVDLLAREPASPAFRENFRKHMAQVLKTTATPSV